MLAEFMTEAEYNWIQTQQQGDVCDCCGLPCDISENQLISICPECAADEIPLHSTREQDEIQF